MKDLQQFLKDRGVPCAGYKKKELVSMCKLAIEVDFEVDPDGLQEDVNVVIGNKLQLDKGDCLPIVPSACEDSGDISFFHLWFILLSTVAGTAAPSTMFRRHYCTRLRYASMLFTSCCTPPHVTFDCSATWRIHIPD